ncbi:MAG: murein biosynthesis integral membrane protein MurJ, partial [Actinomycetota bacterium]|nr:murein biosynthesis integral membrane protein MurJ [Actinomycetota bacterium]
AQTLYLMPVSLFGMSVSAAELPAMAQEAGGDDTAELRRRIDTGLARIAFFVIPSAVAFLTLGGVIAGLIYKTGSFGEQDAIHVWAVLAGSAVGLLAATQGRLYNSAFYALGDPRTPLRYAVVRVTLGTALGLGAALYGVRALGLDPRWGTAGLTAASGLAAWVEFVFLRGALIRRIGATGLPMGHYAKLWGSAGVAALAGWGLSRLPLGTGAILPALIILAGFAMVYGASTLSLGLPEARAVLRALDPR